MVCARWLMFGAAACFVESEKEEEFPINRSKLGQFSDNNNNNNNRINKDRNNNKYDDTLSWWLIN